MLIEKPEILMMCYKYLVQIKSFRESGRNIFFLDETWVDSNITVDKCWQSTAVSELQCGKQIGDFTHGK